ncbi:MAG: thioredoxin family protein [Endomicrobiales bacterium]|nr:thioredoxin family protein [Endomicrobiales bacterium]
MKRNLIPCLLLIAILSLSCTNNTNKKIVQKEATLSSKPMNTEGSIKWVYDLSEGLEAAKNSNKPLMVDFTAGWCSWCKKLDREVFSNPDVSEIAKNFVNVKVDTDKFPDDARKYRVRGLPTILFLNSEGNVIQQIVGYRDSDYFVDTMSKIVKSL